MEGVTHEEFTAEAQRTGRDAEPARWKHYEILKNHIPKLCDPLRPLRLCGENLYPLRRMFHRHRVRRRVFLRMAQAHLDIRDPLRG